MGPYESFLSGKPVITATDAGGPLDVVHDRETGLVVAPEAAAIGAAAAWLREHPDEAAAFGSAREGDRRGGHLGPRDREAALVRVAFFSPMPPERVGDRRLLGAPAARAARALRGHGRQARRQAAAARHRRLRLPRRQRPGGARLDRGRAAADARASSCCTTSCSTTSSRARRSGAATCTATSTRWSATAASSRGCSGTPCSRSASRRCGRAGRRTSRSPARCSASRPALVVHSHYVERRARAAGYAGPVWVIPHPAWPDPQRRAAPSRRRARSSARSATSTPSKRVPQLLEAFARVRAAAARGTAAARRRDLAGLRPRAAAAAARARRGRARPRGLRRRGRGCGR